MGVAADIGRSLRRGPGPVVREHLARGINEAWNLAFLMIGWALVFIGRWPALAREAQETGQPFDRLIAYALLGSLFIWPLVFYFLAGLTNLVSGATGGQGTPGTARLAMFWSWLAASPFALLAGAAGGLFGDRAADLIGILWIGVFAGFWALSQREAARGPVPRGA